jgi:DNA-binding NarL/FixJ family response regulator
MVEQRNARREVPSDTVDDPDDAPDHDVIRVVIVDDHDTVGLGLRALIEHERGISVVEIVGSVADAVDAATRHRPDVMLIDYRLPDGTGADATRTIRTADAPPAVVMITADADRRVLSQALDAGCSGFVSKHADRDDIVAAIRAAAADDSYFTRDVLKHLAHLRRFDQVDEVELGDREIEVLQLTADGFSPDEIAGMLFLSPHTVKNHLRHAMAKLHAHTKLDAVVKAVRARLISIDR